MKWVVQFHDVVLISIVLLLLAIYLFSVKEEMTNSVAKIDDVVDVVYWINLDHREDRKKNFLEEMKKLNLPLNRIVRISATYEPERGHLGCCKSHVRCLETFLESPYKNCLIFEDDFVFTVSPKEIQRGLHALVDYNVNYDVCMLSGSEIEIVDSDYSFLNKVIYATTTSGYLVSRQFAPTLLNNFRESCALLENNYELHCYYAVDQYWNRLQSISNWFIFKPKMGIQHGSFSDILNGHVEYNT